MTRTGNYKRLNILPGQRFGMLTVLCEAPKMRLPSGQTNRAFTCKCDCGNTKDIRLLHLVRKRIRSCGCLGGEQHGEGRTPLYTTWRGIKYRCLNEKAIGNKRYKARGITICQEWKNSYLKFREWALGNGYKDELYIDRIDNNKGYCPENCRFVTNEVNVNNRDVTFRVTYNGELVPFRPLLRNKKLSGHYEAIYNRIKRGWNDQEAIDTPIRKGNYKRRVNSKAAEESSKDIQHMDS